MTEEWENELRMCWEEVEHYISEWKKESDAIQHTQEDYAFLTMCIKDRGFYEDMVKSKIKKEELWLRAWQLLPKQSPYRKGNENKAEEHKKTLKKWKNILKHIDTIWKVFRARHGFGQHIKVVIKKRKK